MPNVSLIDGHVDQEPIKLKPCPFCGGEGVLHKDIELDTVGVFCKHCGCGTPYFHSLNLKHVIDRWNRRAGDESRSI